MDKLIVDDLHLSYGANPILKGVSFELNAGEVVYLGDITPYSRRVDGKWIIGMAYTSHPEDARNALTAQPALLSALHTADIRNEATYGCYGQAMTAYAVPGAPALDPPTKPAETAAAH